MKKKRKHILFTMIVVFTMIFIIKLNDNDYNVSAENTKKGVINSGFKNNKINKNNENKQNIEKPQEEVYEEENIIISSEKQTGNSEYIPSSTSNVINQFITISEDTIILEEGSSFLLNPKSSGPIIYTSIDEEIAKVTSKGVINAKNIGNTKIILSLLENNEVKKEVNIEVIKKEFINEKYTIFTENDIKYIIGMEEKTTILELIETFNNKDTIKVYDSNEDIVEDLEEFVKTGISLSLESNGQVYDKLIVILRGDVDCNGSIDVSDKLILQNHIMNINKIDDYKVYAIDLNNDSDVDINDLSIISNYITKKINTLN